MGFAQDEIRIETERRIAIRYLLRHPIIASESEPKETFTLIQRHSEYIKNWFAEHPGWRLLVEPNFIRLFKIPARIPDPGRPAKVGRVSLTKRAYALFCITAAALERLDRQTTIVRLAEAIESVVATNPKLNEMLRLDFTQSQGDRSDLVQAVKLLQNFHILEKIDGDAQQYVTEQGEKKNALYNIHRQRAACLLNIRHSPTLMKDREFQNRIRKLLEEVTEDDGETSNKITRMHLFRLLLEDPVVYYDELTQEQLEYLHSQKRPMLEIIKLATGMDPEVRKEGIALVDESDDLTDVSISETSTDGVCTFYVANFFADRLRAGGIDVVIGVTELEIFVANLITLNQDTWKKESRSPGADRELTSKSCETLLALGLIRKVGNIGFQPRPAIARFAIKEQAASSESIFNEQDTTMSTKPRQKQRTKSAKQKNQFNFGEVQETMA